MAQGLLKLNPTFEGAHMDSNRAIAISLPLLIALVGFDFAAKDVHRDATAAIDEAKTSAPARTIASKPLPANTTKRLAVRSAEPRRAENARAINAVAVLGLGFVNLSASTR